MGLIDYNCTFHTVFLFISARKTNQPVKWSVCPFDVSQFSTTFDSVNVEKHSEFKTFYKYINMLNVLGYFFFNWHIWSNHMIYQGMHAAMLKKTILMMKHYADNERCLTYSIRARLNASQQGCELDRPALCSHSQTMWPSVLRKLDFYLLSNCAPPAHVRWPVSI